MAIDSVLEGAKEAIYCCIDSDGNFRDVPIFVLGEMRLSNGRYKLLKRFIRMLADTNFINSTTKLYINDRYISTRGVNELENRISREKGVGKVIPFNTTLSRIQYDKRKVDKKFGKNFFSDLYFGAESKLDKYNTIINEVYLRYSEGNSILKRNLALELSNTEYNESLSDEEFREFISIIQPYTKSHMDFIRDNIDKKSIGYFNYLLSVGSLDGVDSSRYKVLENLLKIQ